METFSAAASTRAYRPRHPERTVLYRALAHHFDRFLLVYEERFEPTHGYFRTCVEPAVHRYLDCGDLSRGFARVYCDACKNEYLLAFSCSRRGLCPSCAAKRGAILGALLRDEVMVEPMGQCLWTFTVPKLLRPYFLHRRELIGRLCRAAWQTVSALIAEATAEDTHPGMVAAVHTASSDLRWHPHVHALASRGGWDKDGTWSPVAYVDPRAAELLFRQKVIAFLVWWQVPLPPQAV